ncbi:AAA family ATPase [Polyangium sp. 15x6]|uniref:AAA family ATPase n=1 Tax=Polyangium sp. 15x6 TaxID=3042687 RepID=UPI00249C9123|nr:AAA family ATPase [Polyangium sp. 15x6]MDI3285273.1 AAA family ATPase [Polyangium sp. 15x6]
MTTTNGTTEPAAAKDAPSSTDADDPIPAAAERLAKRLRPVIHPGIKALEKKTLASFAWERQGKRQSTAVVLKEVKDQRAGASNVIFTLAWQPKGGKEVEVQVNATITIQIQRGRTALLLQIRIYDGTRTVNLGRGESIPKWEAGEKNVVVFPYPSSAIGVERAGQVWFPKDPSSPVVTRELGIEGKATYGDLAPYWPHFSEKGWLVELPPLPAPLGEAMAKEVPESWGKTVLAFAIWAMVVQPFQQSESGDAEATVDPTTYGLPPVASYWPQRAVNLDPNRVYAELSKTLLLPWHLVAAACASLNAGKHVIFTGPPGCGKSKLAIALAQMVRNAEPVIATASPAWTAGDLVGRYLPRRDGKGLEFKPGFFLRAVESNRCLVIDEFNRANIDQCFGELFAVFAGDPVELPFEQALEDTVGPMAAVPATKTVDGMAAVDGAGATGDSDGNAITVPKEPRHATVRILPTTYTRRHGARPEEEGVAYRDYKVSPEFRLVGTMNDADRAQLHQLSFALLRRFDILRVEAPAPEKVKDFISDRITKISDTMDKAAYQFEGQGTKDLLQRLRAEYLEPLFSNVAPKSSSAQPFVDLVAERAIGLATVEDILRFLSEGLRSPSEGERVASGGVKEPGLAAGASYLAMGLVLSVFPQLDALDAVRRRAAIAHIVAIFHREGKGAPFVHIEGKRDDKTGKVTYQLVKPSARSFRPKDINKDNEISIAEYLIGELSLQYQDLGDDQWESLVRHAAGG